MANVRIEPGGLGARLRSDANGMPRVLRLAMFSAAQRGKSYIVGESPVDRGILRNAWKVVKLSDGAELVNDQPYAGVMERGARPFKISKEGMEALKGWVRRKILAGELGSNPKDKLWAARKRRTENKISNKSLATRAKAQAKKQTKLGVLKHTTAWEMDEQVDRIAWAIAKKFEKVGIQGRRFVYASLPKLALMMDAEFIRFMTKFFNRSSGNSGV